MDGEAAAQRGNLSTLVELLRSSARLIRNGALSDRGAANPTRRKVQSRAETSLFIGLLMLCTPSEIGSAAGYARA